MQVLDIPIEGGLSTNLSTTSLSNTPELFYDGYLDELKGINRRPGLSFLADLGSLGSNYRGVQGIKWWEEKRGAIVLFRGYTYRLEKGNSGYVATAITTDVMDPVNIATFAVDASSCYTANGGRITRNTWSGTATFLTDGDAPTSCTHVAFLDNYLLATNSNQSFYFSELLDPLTWDPLDFASSSRDPDIITALHVRDRNIYLFGTRSVEIWENNGRDPFAPINGGLLRRGCSAKYSIINNNEGIFWLDNERNFVKMGVAGIDILSVSVSKTLKEFTTVSDCTSCFLDVGGQKFIVLTFSAEQRSLTYHLNTQQWYEWSSWDSPHRGPFLGRVAEYGKDWGICIVGGANNSKLFSADLNNYDDDTYNINTLVRTGHIDRGSSKKKRCNKLTVVCKRGEVGLSYTPQLYVRWRDEGGPWSQGRHLSLGDSGQSSITLTTCRLGTYKRRQWEISNADPVPLVIAKMTEEFEVLG